MSRLLVSIWPLFALILAGYVARRKSFPNVEFWPGAERLNYFVLFPALLFKSLVAAPLTNPALPRVALCVVVVLGACWIGLVVLRRLYRWPPARFGVLVQGTLRFNTYIGLAVIGSTFGAEGLTMAALLLAVTVPAVNVLSVIAFSPAIEPRALILLLLKNPLIVACLLGILANLAGVELVGGTDTLLAFLAATSLPLGLLCVGAALQFVELRGETSTMLWVGATRLLLVPLLAYVMARFASLPHADTAILVIFFALPSAPTAYVLARQLGGDARLMAGIITLQTLLAALTLPVVLEMVR